MSAAPAAKLPPVVWQGMVKVQRSLAPGSASVLIHNEDRSVQWEGEAGRDILKWFDEHEYKFYAKAKLRGTVIHILRKHREPRHW